MDGVKKDKVTYTETSDSFVIIHNNRRIIVTGKPNTRLCTYRWKGKTETITFPIIDGVNPVEQVEHFISRYKTSRLSKYLFDFSNMKDPANLLAFDPVNGKMLSEIQLKLKSYIRNC
jgi:hypothetical protein